MRSIEEIPVILANQSGQQVRFEGDCACSIPLPQPRSGNYSEASLWKMAPELYRADLPEGHELVFNYLGDESVVVLNRPAREILNSFTSATAIDNLYEQPGGSIKSHRLLTAVKEMIALGLLVSPHEIRDRSTSRPETLNAWVHVTNHCNLACDYCYLNKTRDFMDIETGKKAVEAVFRSAIASGFKRVKLKYAGGEATLNFPLLIKLHLYAAMCADRSNLELEGVVLTNGVGLSLAMIESLKRNGLRLSISLDGIGQAHDLQRHFINGHGSFSNLERTLDRLEQTDFIPSITVTVTGRNVNNLPETVKYLLGRKLPFTINFYRESECSSGLENLRYTNEQIIRYVKEAFQILEQDLPPYPLLGSLVDRARLDMPHDRPCGVGDSYLVIDQRGGIAKCHMEIEKTITDVLAEDPLSLVRLDQLGILNLPVSEKEGCRGCEWRYWCSGGCPALTYRATGRFDVKSPNCNIYRALLPEVLRLEGLRLLKYGVPTGLV